MYKNAQKTGWNAMERVRKKGYGKGKDIFGKRKTEFFEKRVWQINISSVL